MKIDLDELERKATKPTRRAEDEYGMFRNEVVLALLARIRELEALADGLIHDLAANMSTARIRELDPERAVLEKGAVLP